MNSHGANVGSSCATDLASALDLLPATAAQAELLARAPGNQLTAVEESARADIRAVQGGARIAAERKLEFARTNKSEEERNLREAVVRLQHIEPKIVLKGHRGKVGLIGWGVVMLLLVGLLVVLWIENGAAAQSVLATGAFDVDTIERARAIMLTPVAVGLAFILGFKVLPPHLRRRAFLVVCATLALAFVTWAICFAIQAEQFREDASQPIGLAGDTWNGSSAESEASHPWRSLPAWLMFGCLAVIMALTTFIGHTGVEHYLSRYETWVPNPEHARSMDDIQAHRDEIRLVENTIAATEKDLATHVAEEERAVTQARALYKAHKRRLVNGWASMAMAACLLTGCMGELSGGNAAHHPPAKRNGPVTRVIALSPLLPPAEKAIACEQLESEMNWIATQAPVGSVTVVVDALECVPITRFEAVPGVSRIRKKALAKPSLALSQFLAKPHPRQKDDGRIHLPRLAQTAKQWGLPPGSHVVVLGCPLFLNEGKDKFFSMAGGRVPSDGCLSEDPKLNVFSVWGREKALSEQYWHLGWSDDAVFEDDTHRQAVLRFWSLYFQGQSARLVTAQPSIVAAAEAARTGASDPLMYADVDTAAAAAMVRFIKVHHEVVREIELMGTEESSRTMHDVRASNETEARLKASYQKREETSAQQEMEPAGELAHLAANPSDETRDQHGNLKGSDKDLITDGQMKDRRILMAAFFRDKDIDESPLPAALAAKGFTVEQLSHPLPLLPAFETMLDNSQQLWLWSSAENVRLPKTHLHAIVKRWKEGRLALCLLADNTPYTAEASTVLAAISPGCTIGGEYLGENTLHARLSGDGGFLAESPLFHNITTLYEGTTVSTISGPGLVPVCYASNGSPLIATFQQPGSSRLVIHGGFTSFYGRFWDDAGVSRFAVNCAGWLSDAEAESKGSQRSDARQREEQSQ